MAYYFIFPEKDATLYSHPERTKMNTGADEILEMPRRKSEPPKPPNVNSTDEELEKWSKEYTKWKDENEHLPNLQPVEVVLKNFKQRQQQMQQRQTSQEKDVSTKLIKRVDTLEKKLDKLMKHLGVK